MENKIYGVLDFDNEFYFSGDVLGSCIETKLKNIKIKLHFPLLNPNIKEQLKNSGFHSKNITAPSVYFPTLNPDIDWGQLFSYPNITVQINHVILEILDVSENFEQTIFTNIDNFLDLVFKYCKIISRKIYTNDNKTIKASGSLHLYSINENNVSKIKNTYLKNCIEINMSHIDNNVTLENLSLAIKYASLDKDLPLEYQLILKSYYDLENSDYRGAVINANTALEVTLSKKILLSLESISFPNSENLLKSFQMVSRKFELLKLLNIDIPTSDYSNKIINPRNNAVHKGDFLNKEIASTVISEVEKYLDTFSPLIT